MKSQWDDRTAATLRDAVDERVYSSRLLGADSMLVLHGGGNTSVKVRERNIFGDEEEILYVKGSGWDLETIERAGFAPVRLQALLRLSTLRELPDDRMALELRKALTTPSAPDPSVEAILHALIPHRFVDHTHADAVLTVMNTPSGGARIREIYGDTVLVVPYVMPGFKLARECKARLDEGELAGKRGMILMSHGVFSFADSAKESYERMIDLVDAAESYLRSRAAWTVAWEAGKPSPGASSLETCAFRRELSRMAGAPMIVATHTDPQARGFASRPDLETISQQGPATPDHVLRTKRVPLVGGDLRAYAARYEAYFRENAARIARKLTMLDPAPRVILDAGVGMRTCGTTAREARIVEHLYRHTMDLIVRATSLEAYRALQAGDLFDVEYWVLEQAKLGGKKAGKPFQGEIALVTGAASGIGRACAEKLLACGACVVALDRSQAVTELIASPEFLGIRCDVTHRDEVASALDQGIEAFGGLDIAVLNAGIFPESRPIESLSEETWEAAMRVNLDANFSLMRQVHRYLRLAPNGGRAIVVGSKNVRAPGPGAAAYSVSKAALTQLARVAALEWGADGVRVNVVHPNAVFDTGIWTAGIVEERAKSYGMTPDQYKRSNVLKTEITSGDVAAVILDLCGEAFRKVTGAQVPIDGGNERVI